MSQTQGINDFADLDLGLPGSTTSLSEQIQGLKARANSVVPSPYSEYINVLDVPEGLFDEIDFTPEEAVQLEAHIKVAPYFSSLFALHVAHKDLSYEDFIALPETSELTASIATEYQEVINWYENNSDIRFNQLKLAYWNSLIEEIKACDTKNGNSIYYFLALEHLDPMRVSAFLGFYENYVVHDPSKRRFDPSLNVRLLLSEEGRENFEESINGIRFSTDLQKVLLTKVRRDRFILGAGLHGNDTPTSASSYAKEIPDYLQEIPIEFRNQILNVININENVVLSSILKAAKYGEHVFTQELWEDLKKEFDRDGKMTMGDFMIYFIDKGMRLELAFHEIGEAILEGKGFDLQNDSRASVELAASMLGISHMPGSKYITEGPFSDDANRIISAIAVYIIKSYMRNIERTTKGEVYAAGSNVFINGLIDKKILSLDEDGRVKSIDWNLAYGYIQDISYEFEHLVTSDAERSEISSSVSSIMAKSSNYDYTNKVAARIKESANLQ